MEPTYVPNVAATPGHVLEVCPRCHAGEDVLCVVTRGPQAGMTAKSRHLERRQRPIGVSRAAPITEPVVDAEVVRDPLDDLNAASDHMMAAADLLAHAIGGYTELIDTSRRYDQLRDELRGLSEA